MDSSGYVAAHNPETLERERLSLLEQTSDPLTFQRMAELGVAEGWRCLEVGAGGGSVPRWLADRVAPTGVVVATDIDPRFLKSIDLPGVEVRTHNIETDDLEENAFDLVHCRALVMHISEKDRALHHMHSAVLLGGCLCEEDLHDTTMWAADPAHPGATEFDRIQRANLNFLDSI